MEGCGWCVMIRSAAAVLQEEFLPGPEAAQSSTSQSVAGAVVQRRCPPPFAGVAPKGGGLAACNQAACSLRPHPPGPWLFLFGDPRQGDRRHAAPELGLNLKQGCFACEHLVIQPATPKTQHKTRMSATRSETQQATEEGAKRGSWYSVLRTRPTTTVSPLAGPCARPSSSRHFVGGGNYRLRLRTAALELCKAGLIHTPMHST